MIGQCIDNWRGNPRRIGCSVKTGVNTRWLQFGHDEANLLKRTCKVWVISFDNDVSWKSWQNLTDSTICLSFEPAIFGSTWLKCYKIKWWFWVCTLFFGVPATELHVWDVDLKYIIDGTCSFECLSICMCALTCFVRGLNESTCGTGSHTFQVTCTYQRAFEAGTCHSGHQHSAYDYLL